MPTDIDRVVTVNGEEMRIKDIPDPVTKAEFGLGHFPSHIKGREVHPGDWPYQPDNCILDECCSGKWINNGANLVCPGCGLDCT